MEQCPACSGFIVLLFSQQWSFSGTAWTWLRLNFGRRWCEVWGWGELGPGTTVWPCSKQVTIEPYQELLDSCSHWPWLPVVLYYGSSFAWELFLCCRHSRHHCLCCSPGQGAQPWYQTLGCSKMLPAALLSAATPARPVPASSPYSQSSFP